MEFLPLNRRDVSGEIVVLVLPSSVVLIRWLDAQAIAPFCEDVSSKYFEGLRL